MDFSAGTNNFIADGKRRWGNNVCWDYMKWGHCSWSSCLRPHPKLLLSEAGCDNHLSVVESERLDLWARSLAAAGFVNKLPQISSDPVEDGANDPAEFVCSFGRHRGAKLRDIPTSYMCWCIEQESAEGPLTELVKAYRVYRQTEPYVCSFGKHRGKTVDQIDSDYISWGKAQKNATGLLRHLIAEWDLYHTDCETEVLDGGDSKQMFFLGNDTEAAWNALLSQGVRAGHIEVVGQSTIMKKIRDHQQLLLDSMKATRYREEAEETRAYIHLQSRLVTLEEIKQAGTHGLDAKIADTKAKVAALRQTLEDKGIDYTLLPGLGDSSSDGSAADIEAGPAPEKRPRLQGSLPQPEPRQTAERSTATASSSRSAEGSSNPLAAVASMFRAPSKGDSGGW